MKKVWTMLLLAALLANSARTWACTNFLVTRGASADGSTLVTYAADSHVLYGALSLIPAASHVDGEMLDVYEWDTGKFMGKIPQVAQTYSVVGNMNEFQLVIAETTFGGRAELESQTGAIIDYGSLIYIALQRSKTAREAIDVMANLVEKYGYASSGESFSIADPNEVWVMEMIGKGESEKGAVWVAMRVPDGYISGHANQARITSFPLDDKKNCLYSRDVISFAREKGWFDGKNTEFSFSDTYAPVDFGAARFCDARVYSGFNKVASGMEKYADYALGKVEYDERGVATNRIPLWVKPEKPLTVKDVMEMMRDHYEGTSLDMTKDIGAGPFALPYRWRPMDWEVDGVTYCHERATSTQQTGFSFVSQSRSNLPNPIGGILWFGVDDTYTTCYVPMYCGITSAPEPFAVGNGDLLTYSETSAFWAFNMVANQAYLRYSDMVVDIRKLQNDIEAEFIANTSAIDQAAQILYNTSGEKAARNFLTTYSSNAADNTLKKWKNLSNYLLVKYKDGNVMKEKDGKFLRTSTGEPENPDHPLYPSQWYRTIVDQTGDHFKEIKKSK